MLAGLSQAFCKAPCPVCEAVWGPQLVMLGFTAVAAWIVAPTFAIDCCPTQTGGEGGGAASLDPTASYQTHDEMEYHWLYMCQISSANREVCCCSGSGSVAKLAHSDI